MKKISMPYVCTVIIRGYKLLRPSKMHKYMLKQLQKFRGE